MSDPTPRARQTWQQLRTRGWGSTNHHHTSPPKQIVIDGMSLEVWVRLDDGSRGETTNYELQGAK